MRSGEGDQLKNESISKLFMKAAVVNALIAILWTIIIISPIEPSHYC